MDDQTPGAVKAPLEAPVRPLAGPNMRRMVRAARLLDELGHAGDTLSALEELTELRNTVAFYRRRCDALQAWQSRMRDPERTVVCDILANGFTLDPPFAGDRYGGLRPNVDGNRHFAAGWAWPKMKCRPRPARCKMSG